MPSEALFFQFSGTVGRDPPKKPAESKLSDLLGNDRRMFCQNLGLSKRFTI